MKLNLSTLFVALASSFTYTHVYSDLFAFSDRNSIELTTAAPVLDGTYTTTCLWGKDSEDTALTTAQKVSLTFSGSSLKTQTKCYSDPACVHIKGCNFDETQLSTFKIGKIIPEMYPNNRVYKLSMHDKDLGYGYSCFYLDQKGFENKTVLHLGQVSKDSTAPCEFDDSSDYIFVK